MKTGCDLGYFGIMFIQQSIVFGSLGGKEQTSVFFFFNKYASQCLEAFFSPVFSFFALIQWFLGLPLFFTFKLLS